MQKPLKFPLISGVSLAPGNAGEAIAIQKSLRDKVKLVNRFDKLQIAAGIDCSYDIKNNISYAIIVLLDMDDLKPLASVRAELETTFPYIPGLLSFREIPVVLKALEMLPKRPDFFMVDGQGIAHPRRLGIAAHLGVITDMPALGVAKSLLTGKYKEPGMNKGDSSPLLDKDEKIGTVLRSRDNTKPLYISPGHRMDHETALSLVIKSLTKYRLPEPTRQADKISKIKPDRGLLFS